MTYSIVALDPSSGELGVAVQSHYFSVGPIVPWAEAGVGAVATQSLVDVSYGPKGLDLMRLDICAADALAQLLAMDDKASVRQVAMVDANGGIATHTGNSCIEAAGHLVGEGFSVQANMMAKDTVWDAMAAAFTATTSELSLRLLAALDAAEAEGGDIRGRQSAAMLIVSGTPTGNVWEDRLLELRVEDHPEPLEELRRLVMLRSSYDLASRGDEQMIDDPQAGAELFSKAAALAQGNAELRFWHAVNLAATGKLDDAKELLRPVLEAHGGWEELLWRLPKAGLFPDDPALIRELTGRDRPGTAT